MTARHICAGHYTVIDLAGMIVKGETLPERTMDRITEMSNQHARENPGCTKEEVLDILDQNSAASAAFLSELSDQDLDRTAYFTATDGDVSAAEMIEFVIFESAAEHFENMKKAVEE